MESAAKWTLFALSLILWSAGCASVPSSPRPSPARLVAVCPPIEPLPEELRAELVELLAALEPPQARILRRALAEWQALREQARACAGISAELGENQP